jgi:hypothetical protein
MAGINVSGASGKSFFEDLFAFIFSPLTVLLLMA